MARLYAEAQVQPKWRPADSRPAPRRRSNPVGTHVRALPEGGAVALDAVAILPTLSDPVLGSLADMLNGQTVVVVMPAYNAAATLRQTYDDLPDDIVDRVILTDDCSADETVALARELGLHVIVHGHNRGYGANQKTCYREALAAGAQIVVMVHPDYQYSPKLVTAMASMVASEHYDLVLASRILGGRALRAGMPLYKYVANRALTAAQNLLCGAKLSEYHTGFRAYSRRLLETVPFARNSDDFVFDNQLIAQALAFGFAVGELSCPTRYFADASSIGLSRSVVYGLGVLQTAAAYRLEKMGVHNFPIFDGRD